LFESNLESHRPYTTQAVTQPNGLKAYRRNVQCYSVIIITLLHYATLLYSV